MRFSTIIALLVSSVLANPPAPDVCDADVIQKCLDKFEAQVSLCAPNDVTCECKLVITRGANCYSACPQEAMTRFIQTYKDEKCANFDPFLSRRSVNDDISVVSEQPGLGSDDSNNGGSEDEDSFGSESPQIKDDDEPESFEPEANEPEASEPEASEPNASEPEASEPEASEPEASEPEASEPKASEPEASEPKVTDLKSDEFKPSATKLSATKPTVTKSIDNTSIEPKPSISSQATPSTIALTTVSSRRGKHPSRHTITMLNSANGGTMRGSVETYVPARGKAVTITANDPSSTISLSPQEYQSQLEKSREKAVLRSIRSERAAISKQAAERFNQDTFATPIGTTSSSLKKKAATRTVLSGSSTAFSMVSGTDHLNDILAQNGTATSGTGRLLLSKLIIPALALAWTLL